MAKAHIGTLAIREPFRHRKIGRFGNVETGVESKVVSVGEGDDGVARSLDLRRVRYAGLAENGRTDQIPLVPQKFRAVSRRYRLCRKKSGKSLAAAAAAAAAAPSERESERRREGNKLRLHVHDVCITSA